MAEEGWIEAKPGAGGELAFAAGGRWLVAAAPALDRQLGALERAAPSHPAAAVRIDCGALEALDTVGAWLMLRLQAALARRGASVSLENLASRFRPLLAQAEKYRPQTVPCAPRRFFGPLDALGAL